MKDKVVWMLSVRWQHSGFPLHYLFSVLGVVWPTLVMRTRVTVCLESRGNAVQPCPWITAQPHKPLHSHCLLRLHLDCKSQALLTHLCCLSPRLMAITSVCFFSEGREENYKNQMLLWKQAEWKHWQLMESWQPPLRGITTVDLSHKCSKVIPLVKMCSEINVNGLMGSSVSVFILI